jgi:replicative DNA helicase
VAEQTITLLRGTRAQADGLSRLLLRFGISTEQRRHGETMVLSIEDRDSRRRFLREVGFGHRAAHNDAAELMLVEPVGPARAEAHAKRPISLRDSLAQALSGDREASGRDALPSMVAVLDGADLDLHAVNDVLWDEVASIELDGVEEVFDATVLGTHNFVANGIAVHNSIEQDADMVILLHREAAYEKDSPREGEADLIVAKHRNGPTDTIVVAFQGHFSRFTNMATNF